MLQRRRAGLDPVVVGVALQELDVARRQADAQLHTWMLFPLPPRKDQPRDFGQIDSLLP